MWWGAYSPLHYGEQGNNCNPLPSSGLIAHRIKYLFKAEYNQRIAFCSINRFSCLRYTATKFIKNSLYNKDWVNHISQFMALITTGLCKTPLLFFCLFIYLFFSFIPIPHFHSPTELSHPASTYSLHESFTVSAQMLCLYRSFCWFFWNIMSLQFPVLLFCLTFLSECITTKL